MRFIAPLILLLAVSFTPVIADDSSGSGSTLSEDALTNMKYDRDFLISKRDSFILAEGDLPVSDIIIKGLKRTSPDVVLAETGIKEGEPLSAFDPHRFTNRLKRRNIFSEIDIRYSRSGTSSVIEITLEEKWTLIPMPMFSGNRHGTVYGFYLMESNFMGYGKYLFGGGTLSSGSGTAMLGYIDPSMAGTRFRSSVFVTYKNEINEHGDVDYNIYREYRAVEKTARIDAGYGFTDNFRWFLSAGYEECIADHGYDDSLNIPEDYRAWVTGTIARYEKLVHYEYLYYGPKFEVYSFRHLPAAEKYSGYTTSGYRIDYSVRFIGYNRLMFSSIGSAGNRPAVFEESIGGKPGARTLPADIIAADNYINYTLTYEYPFLRYRWGAVTLLTFWEQGGFESNRSGMQGYYGPGAGVMVYLKRIALPAMGINVANNLKSGRTEFSVNVGMSF